MNSLPDLARKKELLLLYPNLEAKATLEQGGYFKVHAVELVTLLAVNRVLVLSMDRILDPAAEKFM